MREIVSPLDGIRSPFRTARGRFSPAALFAASEPGGWYDPSDLTTMFQDAAGTTAAALESPVGLVLDKSKGLVLGSEIAGGTPTAYTANGTVSVSGGTVTCTCTTNGNYGLSFGAVATANKRYLMTFEVVTNSAPRTIYGWAGNASADAINAGTTTGVKTGRLLMTGGSTAIAVLGGVAGESFSVRNISVRELPGNHLSQSTSTARPVLSARVNLLTRTEEFNHSDWVKYSVAVTSNAGAAPDGTTTADLLYPTVATTDVSLYRGGFATVGKTHSYCAKAAGKSIFCILKEGTAGGAAWFNLSTGQVGTVAAGYTASISSLGNGWYRCSVTSTSGFSQYTAISAVDADNSTTPTPNGTDGVLIWGADLRPSNAGVGLPAYQRVGAATYGVTNPSVVAGTADYDATGFPYYLKGDGVDDHLLGPNISNLITASDYEACVGARFNAVTTNTVPWLNQSLIADSGGYVGIGAARSTGVIGAFNYDTNADEATVAMVAPATIVLQQRHTGGNIIISTNGGTEASAASDNTGSISSQTRVLRAFEGVYTNGHIYGIVIRQTPFTAGERTSIRDWMNSKTKAF